LDRVLEKYDKNKNGTIEFDEFRDIVSLLHVHKDQILMETCLIMTPEAHHAAAYWSHYYAYSTYNATLPGVRWFASEWDPQ
jgi:hypothetical protein